MKTLIFFVVILLLPFKIQAQLEPILNLDVKEGDHLFTWKLNKKNNLIELKSFLDPSLINLIPYLIYL